MARNDKEITLMQLGDFCSHHDCGEYCPLGKIAKEHNTLCPAVLRIPEVAQCATNFLMHRRVHKEKKGCL